MTIIVYQCDTCLRTVQRVRNEKGLEVFGRCVITKGCKGELFPLESIRKTNPITPPSVPGLVDWQPRRLLYNHTQGIRSNEWTIQHGLGGDPTISLYLSPPSATFVDIDNVEPAAILSQTFVDENTKTVTLQEADGQRIGVAQAILRSSTDRDDSPKRVQPESTVSRSLIPAAPIEHIPLALRVGAVNINAPTSLDLVINYIDKETGSQTVVPTTIFPSTVPGPSWSTHDKVLIESNVEYSQIYWLTVPTEYRSQRFAFFVTSVSGSPLNRGDLRMLLSTSPNEIGDEIVDKTLDMDKVTQQNSKLVVSLGSDRISVDQSILDVVYPTIRSL